MAGRMSVERKNFHDEPWRIEKVDDPRFINASAELRGAWKQKRSLTPELIDHFYGNLWRVIGDRTSENYAVPQCAASESDLSSLRAENRGVLLVPANYASPHGLVDMAKFVPNVRYEFLMDALWGTIPHMDPKGFKDLYGEGGNIAVELDIDAPNRNMTLFDASTMFRSKGRRDIRLGIYGLAGVVSKLINDEYLDPGDTWTRTGGTKYHAGYAFAKFDPEGTMHAEYEWHFHSRYDKVGHRSEELIR